MSNGWIPITRLGKLVADGQITTMEAALDSGLPIREPQIIDTLIPDIVDEVIDINMVQRMTDSGRRVKFRAAVIVGNSDGFIGYGQGKDVQVGNAIVKAIKDAKLNIVNIKRGCGSWECVCGAPHTVPFEVTGKAGSVIVVLKPAPRGLGIAAVSPAAIPSPLGAGLSTTMTLPALPVTSNGTVCGAPHTHSHDPQPRFILTILSFASLIALTIAFPTCTSLPCP